MAHMGPASAPHGSVDALLEEVKKAPAYQRDDGTNCSRCNCLNFLMCFQVRERILCATCYEPGGVLYRVDGGHDAVPKIGRLQAALRWYASGTAPGSIGDFEGDAASVLRPSVFQGVCPSYPSVSSATIAQQIDLLNEDVREKARKQVGARVASGKAVVRAVGVSAAASSAPASAPAKKRKDLVRQQSSEKEDQPTVRPYMQSTMVYPGGAVCAPDDPDPSSPGWSDVALFIQLVVLMRRCFGCMWWPKHPITSVYDSTLMLLGAYGTGTGLHVDWSEAVNLALAIDGQFGVLATWLFISPLVIAELDEFLRADTRFKARFPNGLKGSGDVALNPEDMTAIKGRFPPGCVYVVEQSAGMCVRVPPGWIHAVWNCKPCLKLAFDFYVTSHFRFYQLSHANTAPFFTNAPDYMGWMQVAYDELAVSAN